MNNLYVGFETTQENGAPVRVICIDRYVRDTESKANQAAVVTILVKDINMESGDPEAQTEMTGSVDINGKSLTSKMGGPKDYDLIMPSLT